MKKKIKDGYEGFRLTKEAREVLRTKKQDTGLSKTQIIEDLLLDKRQHPAEIERLIEKGAEAAKLTRADFIQRCIINQSGKVIRVTQRGVRHSK